MRDGHHPIPTDDGGETAGPVEAGAGGMNAAPTIPGDSFPALRTGRYAPGMAKDRRIYKLKWRSKKANHGRKPCRGRDKKMK